MVQTSTKLTNKLPPSTHEFAEVIYRLEAGGSMLPDTPENLMQIIGIYKAYAIPMDFYWRNLLYIAERVFLNPLPFFKYFLPQEYLELPNHYAGDHADLKVWRGKASAHPELLEFIEKGTTRKMPKLFHHLWHDRINMEFAEACMQAMLWHGRDMGLGKFDAYLDTEEYRANADRRPNRKSKLPSCCSVLSLHCNIVERRFPHAKRPIWFRRPIGSVCF